MNILAHSLSGTVFLAEFPHVIAVLCLGIVTYACRPDQRESAEAAFLNAAAVPHDTE